MDVTTRFTPPPPKPAEKPVPPELQALRAALDGKAPQQQGMHWVKHTT